MKEPQSREKILHAEKLEGRQISMPFGIDPRFGKWEGKRQPLLRNAVSRVHTQSDIGLGFAGRLEPGYGRDLSPAITQSQPFATLFELCRLAL